MKCMRCVQVCERYRICTSGT
ncbi:MAG: hypothetical protein ACLRSW_09860 [Christensenellaceae bacterium]